jgi:hypothetical protein
MDAFNMAVYYGLTEAARFLLSSGRYGANEEISYGCWTDPEHSEIGRYGEPFRPVHVALVAPKLFSEDPQAPPRLEILSMLVHEFGADVNTEGGFFKAPPLHWLIYVPPQHRAAALDLLLSLEADLERRDRFGATPIFEPAREGDHDLLQLLLSRGASVDVFDRLGRSPLIEACLCYDTLQPALSALLRASSRETLRAVDCDGRSAIDCLAGTIYESWCNEAIVELLSAGTPVLPQNISVVLIIVAELGERRAAELAAVERKAGTTWREHERFVKLAFDEEDGEDGEEEEDEEMADGSSEGGAKEEEDEGSEGDDDDEEQAAAAVVGGGASD